MTEEKLFYEFSKPTKQEWINTICKDLKLDHIQELDWQTDGLMHISPFNAPEDLGGICPPVKNKAGWEIGTEICIGDLPRDNIRTLEFLNRGCQNITFDCRDFRQKLDFGLLLKDIQLEWVSTHLLIRSSQISSLTGFIEFARKQSLEPEKIRVSLEISDWPLTHQKLAQVMNFRKLLPQLAPITFSDRSILDLKSGVGTIAKLIHEANQHLVQVHKSGWGQGGAPRFIVSLSDDYLTNICYLRAFIIAWANILFHWKMDWPEVMLTCYLHDSVFDDTDLRKISFTSQAMAAIVGGADRIIIASRNGNSSLSDQRLHLNIQHILALESHFDWMTDPAAGSYFFERTTDQLAASIWREFQHLQA